MQEVSGPQYRRALTALANLIKRFVFGLLIWNSWPGPGGCLSSHRTPPPSPPPPTLCSSSKTGAGLLALCLPSACISGTASEGRSGWGWEGAEHVPGCTAEQTGQVAVEHLRGQGALLNPCLPEHHWDAAATTSMAEQRQRTERNALIHLDIYSSFTSFTCLMCAIPAEATS